MNKVITKIRSGIGGYLKDNILFLTFVFASVLKTWYGYVPDILLDCLWIRQDYKDSITILDKKGKGKGDFAAKRQDRFCRRTAGQAKANSWTAQSCAKSGQSDQTMETLNYL